VANQPVTPNGRAWNAKGVIMSGSGNLNRSVQHVLE
jgi:hypothetical protein